MPSSRSFAELGDFLTALRVNGVPVGPTEIDQLRRLFALAPNLDRQGLRSMLCALLAKTPEHRQTFEALFADWCPERDADWPADVTSTVEPSPLLTREPLATPASSPTDDTATVRRRMPWSVWALLGSVALLAVLLWVLWPRPVVITPPPERPEVVTPLPPETSTHPDDLPATPVETVWFWQVNVKPFTVPRRLTPLELAALGLLPLATALLVSLRYRHKFREITPLAPSQGYGWHPLPPPGRDDTALMAAAERRQLVWNIEHFLSDDPTGSSPLNRGEGYL